VVGDGNALPICAQCLTDWTGAPELSQRRRRLVLAICAPALSSW
jgi:hypothetical protein